MTQRKLVEGQRKLVEGQRELVAEGSVKNIYSCPSADQLDFEFSDAYSVFDWGRMPDALPGKGEALALIGAHFFERLRQDTDAMTLNVKTHFVERVDARTLRVRRAQVFRPELQAWFGEHFYVYPTTEFERCASLKLLPLEVVFRFGAPTGSSFFNRVTEKTARALGAAWPLAENTVFHSPIVEFFTKLEDSDRYLNPGDAMLLCGLSQNSFAELAARTTAVAKWLRSYFAERGLELWDGKLEWGVEKDADGEARFVLLDSIGPDELRLIEPASRVQVSKEFLRMIYRKSAWFERRRAGDSEVAPPPLPRETLAAAGALYPALADLVCAPPPAAREREKLKAVCQDMVRALAGLKMGWSAG